MILLIEDNQDHADLIIRSLKGHDLAKEIRHICDGEAALNYLFGRNEYAGLLKSPCPGMILLDLRLPKVDGLEVLKEIKSCERLRRIPVVILTTSEAEKDISSAYNNHANSYIVKPVDFDKFTELMSSLCYYWLGWNQAL